ncbi:hypothetical protein MTO96_041589 [Rhipicephalus appendiculatus]
MQHSVGLVQGYDDIDETKVRNGNGERKERRQRSVPFGLRIRSQWSRPALTTALSDVNKHESICSAANVCPPSMATPGVTPPRSRNRSPCTMLAIRDGV